MNIASDVTEALRDLLEHPRDGIAGLVDDLLALCHEHNLQLDWQPGRYLVRTHGADWKDLNGVRLRPSVFRAILARFAVLCSSRTQEPPSPYRGEGEIPDDANPSAAFKVVFVNTAAEQRLELAIQAKPIPEQFGSSDALDASSGAGSRHPVARTGGSN